MIQMEKNKKKKIKLFYPFPKKRTVEHQKINEVK